MKPAELMEQLVEPEFCEAIGVLEMISKSEEDLQYYEDRLKYLRDEAAKFGAAREEGLEEGLERGLEEGRQEGERFGIVKGRAAGKADDENTILARTAG